jgi:GxxExxY protein
VYRELGSGFRERVYQRALRLALKQDGFSVGCEVSKTIWFRDLAIGRFRADLVVDDLIVLELKSLPELLPSHVAQLLNMLRATKLEVGLLLNFGPIPQVKRVVVTGDEGRTARSSQR